MVVVARIVSQKEPERWQDADFAEVDPVGRLRILTHDGRLLDLIEPGDWIDAQVDDGPVIRPPQAF